MTTMTTILSSHFTLICCACFLFTLEDWEAPGDSSAAEGAVERVEIVDEHYTSKTCGRCGRIHQKLGGKKVFRCPRCRLEADRDIHAARNVLLCFLAHQDIIVAKGRELHGQSPAALGPTPVNASTHCGAFVQDLQNVQV